MYYVCIMYVLDLLLLALSRFSWIFCVRGDFCLCFCWFYPAFLGFFASAGIFVCVFAGFIRFFLGSLRPRGFLSVFLMVLSGFSWVFCVRGDFCMCFCWLFLGFWRPRRFLYVLFLAFVRFFGVRKLAKELLLRKKYKYCRYISFNTAFL